MRNLPSIYTSKYFDPAQKESFDIAQKLISGDVPDTYKDVYESGGESFQKLLAQVNAGITRGVTEAGAKMGVRGGSVLEQIAKGTGESGVTLGYQDLMRALGAKERGLGMGIETMGGVRGAALSKEQLVNQFNLGVGELGLSGERMDLQREMYEGQQEATEAGMFGDILSGLIGAGTSIYTGGQMANVLKMLGKAGKATGSTAYNPPTGSDIFNVPALKYGG